MKVALVHDYLKEYGGAERVLEALHEIFPEAPIFTAYYDPKGLGSHAARLKGWDIRTSWIQKLPLAEKLISPFRLLAPAAFESFDLKEYDLVISSCAIYFAKAVITRPDALHISYIHTPPRYLYGYTTSYNYQKHLLTKIFGELANHFLRIWDFETSQRPDILVANSKNVQARIKKFYRRDSVVICPPVDINKFKIQSANWRTKFKVEKEYYLSLGRLVRGKGTEVIVAACTKLGLPLKVAGTGPELENLEKIAGKSIQFLGQVKEEDLPELYGNAKVVIVASEDEDFGIVPVEAQASGTPVIAPRFGGFLETVVDSSPANKSSAERGKTGMLYGEKGSVTVESLIEGIRCFNDLSADKAGLNHSIKANDCLKQAEKFSKERFKKEIIELVDKNLKT